MRPRPRLMIAEDHRILTDVLTPLLCRDFDVAGTFPGGQELLSALANTRVDAVVLDISMPGLNGLETARLVSAHYPQVRIVFLTMHTERPYVEEAFRSGGTAYILKREAASDLVHGIHAALQGIRYISPSAAQVSAQMDPARHDVLTARQRQVLQLVAEGKTAKEIANALEISFKTVEFHKAKIMDRLGLRTTAELTRYALQHLISTP